MIKINNSCGCLDDILCVNAKKLWKLKSLKSKREYSCHRLNALGLLNDFGTPKIEGYTIWPNHQKYEQ